MFAIRLALLVSLLLFRVIALEGSGLCPHGGMGHSSISSDQGGATDPDGLRRTSAVSGDKGLGVDPNG